MVSGMVKVKGRPVAYGEVTLKPTGGAAAGTAHGARDHVRQL